MGLGSEFAWHVHYMNGFQFSSQGLDAPSIKFLVTRATGIFEEVLSPITTRTRISKAIFMYIVKTGPKPSVAASQEGEICWTPKPRNNWISCCHCRQPKSKTYNTWQNIWTISRVSRGYLNPCPHDGDPNGFDYIYIYIQTDRHRHTHTHIYIYMAYSLTPYAD